MRPAFVQDVKKRKKNIKYGRFVKDVMTKQKASSQGFFTGYKNFLTKKELQIKMSSVMPLTFNAVELCVVTINENPWTRAREVCRALEYGKATKTADNVKRL